MNQDIVIDVGQHALMIIIMLSAPVLLTGLAVGLLIGMLQAATSIQEMTLSFIPKLLAMFVALMVFGSWMLDLLVEYVLRLYDAIPGLIG
ncbi:flagellar biosynthesis protein FliQ [Ectothiorhodospira mobilis]|jgi:flagellar biosynthetic protein FliQ|uniref:Flagellar biosynthetic protein FliQ n=1 Tax=Ectothiorhodospira mobilis TaxID=195064 RepID=A0A1I4QHR1_ECTMO|nr:flagellar biosynthesis protein FliQ [Ectothiorhodospira mobilis]MCG5535051.1 flagellar biosynthesis protein FliQ [Ectothiorhodospira mobilis]SFM39609.1 flagellar biosynthetic protein FliQ [Ectothiorhodospira mobilis]